MTSSKQQKGVIDPISIIAGIFLVISLIVGTTVVTNKNFSLNIAEKAGSCYEDCRVESGSRVCDCRCNGNCTREDSYTDPIAVRDWGVTPPPTSVPVIDSIQNTCSTSGGFWCAGCGGFCLSGSYSGGGCNAAQQERCGQAPVTQTSISVCNAANEGVVVV